MAYVAFPELGGCATARHADSARPVHHATPVNADDLTALEWSVVAIARTDGRASLRRPGRLSRAWRLLVRQRNPELADPRLEALRRMAVLTWRDGAVVAPQKVRAFLDAGFTLDQYRTMAARIGAVGTRLGAADPTRAVLMGA